MTSKEKIYKYLLNTYPSINDDEYILVEIVHKYTFMREQTAFKNVKDVVDYVITHKKTHNIFIAVGLTDGVSRKKERIVPVEI